MLRIIALCLIFAFTAGMVSAQSLDGRPYDPAVDPNIDLYMNSWENSQPRTIRGTLVERDILTRGDPMKPPAKGAVLYYTNRFVYATVEPGKTTEPATLDREQEVYFILGGEGTMKTTGRGSQTVKLYPGMTALVPMGKTFTIATAGTEPLSMYIVAEPVPNGFKPRKDILAKDENTLPIVSTNGHWAHIVKNLYAKDDGLATMYSVLTVAYDPMTIGHPHSHDPGCEEVWTAINGTSIAFLGKQLRMQPPGTAYNIPPDGNTPHCNINTTDRQINLFYFSVRKDIDGTGLERP